MANLKPIQYTHGESFWRIHGVQYGGKSLTVELLDGLLPAMTQAEAGAHAKANPDKFTAQDLPMYFGILRALEQQQTEWDVSAPVAFLRKSMQDNYLMTLTGIAYMPKGEDVVIHGVGTEKPYQKKVDVAGLSRQITQEDSACLEALVGTGNVGAVDKVFRFINGTPTYLFRVNYKPPAVERRVARFDAYADVVGLDCDGDPQDPVTSLGVRRVAPLRLQAPR
ncbi:MAG: hypothetical protein HY438_03625 [DPANN group archaeon]|nr:hypothetical protein [DPANN group archaeon]